jgi:hypothetical protein
MVLTPDGKLTDRSELLTFGPNQRNPLMPSLDLDSSSAVVCSIEGSGVLRLFFASKSRARLIVKRYETEQSLTFPGNGLTEIPRSDTFLAQIAFALTGAMPGPFFENPELDKFHSSVGDLIGAALERIDAGHALPQFLELVRATDQELSAGRKLADGFAIFFSLFNT